jgi:replicative DNA helicase
MDNGQSIALQKLPPQNVEMEQSILGAILQNNDAIVRLADTLQEEDFYHDAHRWLFRAMLDLFQENVPIDVLTVNEWLKKKNRLDAIGGPAYLAELVELVPTAAHVDYHARVVREKSVLRALIRTATTIVADSYEADEDVAVLLDRAERSILEISQGKATSGFVDLQSVLKDSFRQLESLSARKEPITGLPTGFSDLDRQTAGLQSSDLIVIAGRPSMGKTTLALNIAAYAGMRTGKPIAIFSLEMSKEQLALRMLCAEAKVDSAKLRTGFLAGSDWSLLTTAAGDLSGQANIYIDDTPMQTALDIRAKARRLRAEQGELGLVIVDYLQLMQGRSRAENRQQEISDITRALKALARELQVPVVALSQLSRAVEQRRPPKPQLSDLRESGAIEQDADVVALLYRDDLYNEDSDERGVAEVNIAKHRNGPTGTLRLAFRGEFTRFDNLARQGDY